MHNENHGKRSETLPGAQPGEAPLVSVVIPTHHRPHLVTRAVTSALAQTLADIEVIVVIDGPDPETVSVLDRIADPRLRVRQLPARAGGCSVRNRGIEAARARWVALLDDDDEWNPDKLAVQLQAAEASSLRFPIVCCRALVCNPTTSSVMPRRLPGAGEHISDYLMVRRGPFYGEGLIQTSMIFAPRELMTLVPFSEGLIRHHETDWLLRATQVPGAEVTFVDRVLTTWFTEERRRSISAETGWKPSLRWALENRALMTSRAFAAFVMTIVSNLAERDGDRDAFWTVLRTAREQGAPTSVEYLLFAAIWLIPQRRRWTVRNFLLKLGKRSNAPFARLRRLADAAQRGLRRRSGPRQDPQAP